jgi:hypothetical protein
MPGLWVTAGQAAYLLLPCLGGAAVSGFVLRWNIWRGLARPIDRGRTFRGRRLLGDHKTWRGFVCSVIGSTVTIAAQKYAIGGWAANLAILDYQNVDVLGLGVAFGIGIIVGELPNSFLKRQLDIPAGESPHRFSAFFHVLDQVDFLLLLWPLLFFWIRPAWTLVLTSFGMVFVVHQLVSVVGYRIGALRASGGRPGRAGTNAVGRETA